MSFCRICDSCGKPIKGEPESEFMDAVVLIKNKPIFEAEDLCDGCMEDLIERVLGQKEAPEEISEAPSQIEQDKDFTPFRSIDKSELANEVVKQIPIRIQRPN